jgi:hypothetical protein
VLGRLSLGTANRVGPVRRLLMRHALGIEGELPVRLRASA